MKDVIKKINESINSAGSFKFEPTKVAISVGDRQGSAFTLNNPELNPQLPTINDEVGEIVIRACLSDGDVKDVVGTMYQLYQDLNLKNYDAPIWASPGRDKPYKRMEDGDIELSLYTKHSGGLGPNRKD